ncbi:Basic-leucine zipper domain [Sesbania bispinosa]|nr:Basic-leucine zipper domain [Sesbania bispinosa]
MVVQESEMNSQGEVESVLQREQEANKNNNYHPFSSSLGRQSSIYSLTLDEFQHSLWVVREQPCNTMQHAPPTVAASHHHQQQQHYAMYPNNSSTIAPFIGGGGAGNVVAPPYQGVAQGSGGVVGEPSGYVGNGKRDGTGGYPLPPPGACFGGRVVNGGGGFGVAPSMGMGAPVSPASSDGIGAENSGGQFGLDMSGLRGRKRMVDGPVEKVVERRQRRMIKNRESAARSRARKQAYTVELEAELNQLKEENAQLKQALVLPYNKNFCIMLSSRGGEGNRGSERESSNQSSEVKRKIERLEKEPELSFVKKAWILVRTRVGYGMVHLLLWLNEEKFITQIKREEENEET